MATKGHLKVSKDQVSAIRDSIRALADREVLVGFPEDTSQRQDDPTGPTNAALGYIHDHGAPEQSIPARPFMIPGMRAVRDRVTSMLQRTAKRVVIDKSALNVDMEMEKVGLVVATSIKREINEGVPPPLAEATLRGRMARGPGSSVAQGAFWELAWRDAGAPASTEIAKPLIDTGQLRNAVNFVVRSKRKRK